MTETATAPIQKLQETETLDGGASALDISMGTKIGLAEEIRFRNLVEENINQLVKWVNEDMQVDLDLSGVKFKLVSQQELQHIKESRKEPDPFRQTSLRKDFQDLIRSSYHSRRVLGTWSNKERTLYVTSNFQDRASDSAILKTIYHELVHIAQHQQYPDFMEQNHPLFYSSTPQERRDRVFSISSDIIWYEGQAIYLANANADKRFPGAAILSTRFSSKVLSRLAVQIDGRELTHRDRELRQAGHELFRELYGQPDGQKIIDDAYRNPYKIPRIVEKFFEKEFPLGGAPFTRHPEVNVT